jgi:hypothetical protein
MVIGGLEIGEQAWCANANHSVYRLLAASLLQANGWNMIEYADTGRPNHRFHLLPRDFSITELNQIRLGSGKPT